MASSLHIPLLLLFSLLVSASTTASISVGRQFVNERRLLQLKKPCSVDFENQNYTVLTSKCKGPDYPPEPCCSGLKEIACPYADEINDFSTDCSTVMFSYINNVGSYPPGLFASICREGKDGLECPASPPPPVPNAAAPVLASLLFMALLLFPLLFFV